MESIKNISFVKSKAHLDDVFCTAFKDFAPMLETMHYAFMSKLWVEYGKKGGCWENISVQADGENLAAYRSLISTEVVEINSELTFYRGFASAEAISLASMIFALNHLVNFVYLIESGERNDLMNIDARMARMAIREYCLKHPNDSEELTATKFLSGLFDGVRGIVTYHPEAQAILKMID